MSTGQSPVTVATVLRDFFCKRLINQKNASPETVASYRDTFRLLLRYAQARTNTSPATLPVADLDAELVLSFLEHLERERANSVRSRNARLTAIRSFMHYAALCDPLSLPTIQRVLAIPSKRFERPLLTYLSREEVQAILNAPHATTWSGQRDRVMLTTLYNTGARVSEITGLRIQDIQLGRGAYVHLRGKGCKQRAVPLWKSTASQIKAWLPRVANHVDAPLFPNRHGKPLARFGVSDRLRVAVNVAQKRCPTLTQRRISPHTLRHSTAMHLLQSGVDITVIALWLGHESPATTHMYVEADLAMKERALRHLHPPSSGATRYRPPDHLLAFLEGL